VIGDNEYKGKINADTWTGGAAAAQSAGISPAVKFQRGPGPLRFIKRNMGREGSIILMWNPSERQVTTEIEVGGGCGDPRWIDAWSGKSYKAMVYEDGSILSYFEPYASVVLACDPEAQDLASVPAEEQEFWTPGILPGTRDLVGNVIAEVDMSGEEAASFVLKEIEPGSRIVLDLGWLYGAAEVKVNGRDLGTLLIPPYALDVTDYVYEGDNRIEVKITPALRNELIGKSEKGDKRYRQFKGKGDTRLPSGLIGPVYILKLNEHI
jgi:hypothetical protein